MTQPPSPQKRTLTIYMIAFALFTCCAGVGTFGGVYTLLGDGGAGGAAAAGNTPTAITQVAQQTPILAGSTPTALPTDESEGSAGDGAATIMVVEVVDPATPGAAYSPAAGTRLVALRVVIENSGTEAIDIAPGSIALEDDAAASHPRQSGASDEYHDLGAVSVLPGERTSGWMLYAVPEGAAPSEIVVSAGGGEIGRGAATATTEPTWPTITAPAEMIAEIDGYRIKVIGMNDPAPSSETYTAPTGWRLVSLEIKLFNNTGAAPMPVDAARLVLIDDRGFVRPAMIGASDRGLETSELAADQTTKGFVSFELPEGVLPLYVRYAFDALSSVEALMASVIVTN